jgi:hypothetical protein
MKIEVKQKHIDLAPKLFSKGVNAKECCPISCAVQDKFPDKLVSVGWMGSPDYASKMFPESFFISVTDPENDYEEVIKDNSISDLELCSKFAEQYDNGDKVKPFEFEIK